MKIVLIGEGAGEVERVGPVPPAPGSDLEKALLGPGHVLVRRLIAGSSAIPEAAVRFQAPLRTRSGKVATGSDLHRPQTLRRLLTYLASHRRPDLAVVLVDEDGVAKRRRDLRDALPESHPTRHVLAVAVREFEGWLVSDHRAVSDVLACPFDPIDAPENLDPGVAKARLRAVIPEEADERKKRIEIAEGLDLELVSRRSASFMELREELDTTLRALGH